MKFLLLALFLLCFALLQFAHAQEASFSAEVAVDVMGESGVEAREKGLYKAERDGFASLLEKFAPDLKTDLLEAMDDKAVSELVQSREVNEETLDDKRYRASVRVNFSATKLNALIEKRLTDLKQDRVLKQPSTLILPLFFEGETPLLFQPNNRWRSAWNKSGVSLKTGRIVLPYGDMTDQSLMSASKALEADYAKFVPMLRRYGTRDVVVLAAYPTTEGETIALDLVFRRVQPNGQELTRHRVQGDPQDVESTIMYQATLLMADEVLRAQGGTLAELQARDKQPGVQLLVVSITTPKRYTQLLKQLRAIPQVLSIEIVALSATQADLKLFYKESPEALVGAIQAMGARLTQYTNYWSVEEPK